MQFERIKKNHKRKIIIGGLILVCITSVITITTTRAKYKLTEDIPLVKGTINYKPYDFKIMAMYQSEDKTNYTEINEMPGKNYKINESKSYCTIDNINKDDKAKTYTNKYGEHIIDNLQKTDKCYLYFDKNTEVVNTALGDIEVNNYKPDFSKIATTDEGLFKTEDNDGVSYYWRGATTTNYLKFGGFCWRIVRINGDGSIRMIYDGETCHANGTSTTESLAVTNQKYNASYDRSEYVGYTYTLGSQRTTSGTASNLKTQNETWYNSNLASYAERIADGKYCNDRDVASGYSWSSQPNSTLLYVGYNHSGAKSVSTATPTLSCTAGDVYTLKVGAITMDEVVMAGGKWGTINSSYYLYNNNYYWTMSPYIFNPGDTYPARMFLVRSDGHLGSSHVNWPTPGARPVINLRSDITLSSGDGTLNNPYVVE
jgi:hypothetical protein